jgi:hypothetical protein
MEMDAFVKCIKDDFDRFQGMLEKQIDLCPADLWTEKVAGWYFWQQLYHAFYSMEFYTRSDEEPPQSLFSPEVSMLAAEPERHLDKDELHAFAAKMKQRAHAYITATTPQNMDEVNPVVSRRLGRELNRLGTVIAMIRHYNYHLGCCDAIFRERGLAGVY